MSILTESNAGADLYKLTARLIDGQEIAMERYRGSVLLIVNVASRCVLTKQYAELQSLYDRYADRGFYVLGFPCNQFGEQEPKSNEEIQQFCSLSYNVTFPMFAKIEVNGDHTHPLYRLLKHRAKGFLGSESIKWNFTKFLVSRNGETVRRYGPSLTLGGLERAVRKMVEAPAS